jgi:hypothetical protein
MVSLLLTLCAAQADESTCQLRIVTAPEGADVMVDRRPAGVTPVTVTNLVEGEHLVIATKIGCVEARKTVLLKAGIPLTATLTLEPMCGLILVKTVPAGVDVEVAGASRGKTPLVISDLPVATYRFKLVHRGFQSKEVEVTLKDRTPVRVEETLVSDTATIMVESKPAGADVALNGMDKGKTPCTIEQVSPGENELVIESDGYLPLQQKLTLRAGQTETFSATLKAVPATLTVVTLPAKARVYIDSQFKGDAPLKWEEFSPGKYKIRAEMKGYEPMFRTVTIKSGQIVTEEFRLQRNSGIVQLTTEPAGVRVFVDGEEAGETRGKNADDVISEMMMMETLSLGTHKVQLTKAGYISQDITLDIQKDKTITRHIQLKRRFVPDHEVRTDKEVFKGVLLEKDAEGSVRIEIRPGVVKTILQSQIKSIRPLAGENTTN